MLLYLVRHGQSRANADATCRDVDCELTELGRRQAEQVAAHLATVDLQLVLASPYRRTVATAQEIAAAAGAPLELLPSAHEHHGIAPAGWIPSTRAELAWRYPDLPLPADMPEADWHRFPETVEAVSARMAAVLAALRSRFPGGERVALVSHASPIQQMIAAATGAQSAWEATRLTIGNGSLSILDLSTDPATAQAIGQDDFLRAAVPALA